MRQFIDYSGDRAASRCAGVDYQFLRDGVEFVATVGVLVEPGSTGYVQLKTPQDKVVLLGYWVGLQDEDNMTAELYESPSLADGTPFEGVLCTNRAAGTEPSLQILVSPTVSSDGTKLDEPLGRMPEAKPAIIWQLKQSADYVFKITNQAASQMGARIVLRWVEL